MFVAEIPLVRRSILRFMQQASRTLASGSRVLDAGAGDAPYRELFQHCDYRTADFAITGYHDFNNHRPDLVCDLSDIPLANASLDAILCTEVLEHTPEPAHVLREFRRLLVPGGYLFVTTPFLWELHEQPYDYYRFTPFALERLFAEAGFQVHSIVPRGGRFTALALQITQIVPYIPLPSGRRTGRVVTSLVRRMIPRLVRMVDQLDRHDRVRLMTLGYACLCSVPATP